jgi:putative nucleotidyltransferase with HDIG domain
VNRLVVSRVAILLLTTLAAWAVLSLGTGASAGLTVGQIASRNYEARYAADIEDVEATEAKKMEARQGITDVYSQDTVAESTAFSRLEEVINAVRSGVIDPEAPVPTLELPAAAEATTTTATEETAAGETPTTAQAMIQLTGRLFLDIYGDGVFTDLPEEGRRPDQGLRAIEVQVFDEAGQLVARLDTQADGTWNLPVPDTARYVSVNGTDPDLPPGLTLSTANALQELSCDAGGCAAAPVGYRPAVRPADIQQSDLARQYPQLNTESVQTLVAVASEDIVRVALGEPSLLANIAAASAEKLNSEFEKQITPDKVFDVQRAVSASPPLVLIGGTPDEAARRAAANLVNMTVVANYVVDAEETERQRAEAAEAVEPEMRRISQGQLIVAQGVPLEAWHIEAINRTGAAPGASGQQAGLLAVIAALVGSLGFYLARFRQEFWTRPRMAALLGFLVVLAAGAVRLTVGLQDTFQDVSAWYALPGVVFGMMAAVLFDSRIAVLMALAVAVLTATATRDPGIATYGLLATLVPVGFVSSLSSRGSYRKAVLASSLAVAGIAGAVSWFFHTSPDQEPWRTIGLSAGWALGATLLTALLGLAALQFFESAFDITTSLRLLELTDRNHDALLLLQDKAFGTFNHSLMVGTLADAAARAVGANPLLARATAYYHDLGKTENPSFFIENQFGAANPHDDLEPRQSVEIIRKHVTDGVILARKFKIPSEVAEGIVTHHGDGVMRFFYEKARRSEGEVDPADFRHVGHKPRSAETAIVMLADSLEAACRAVFQEEEPTPQAIEKVVARVMDEKVNDDQLSESSLTLGQLTKVRRAFLEALVGHYHQRIAYPNFPGS